MPQLTPSQEKRLYDQDRGLWAVTRVLIHSKQYKGAVWNLLTREDRDHLRNLADQAKEHFKHLEEINAIK